MGRESNDLIYITSTGINRDPSNPNYSSLDL